MIRDVEKWEAFKREEIARTPPDYQRNVEIVEALYEEARALGHFSGSSSDDDLAFKIRFARDINVSGLVPFDRHGQTRTEADEHGPA